MAPIWSYFTVPSLWSLCKPKAVGTAASDLQKSGPDGLSQRNLSVMPPNLAAKPGIHCQTISMIRRSSKTLLGDR